MTSVRRPFALSGATTSLGFVPGLVLLVLAGYVHHLFGWVWIMYLRFPGAHVPPNQWANVWLLLVVAAAFTLWILALARGWVTGATGGGFPIAGSALVLRFVVELPQSLAQTPLAEVRPPEPYASTLVLGRGLGIVAIAFGLACVLAACLSERRLRRSGPAWTLPR